MKALIVGKILAVQLLILNISTYAQNIYRDYYDNKVLKAEGTIVDGAKTGEWKYYYPSSALMAVEVYVDGMLHGVAQNFFPGGKLQSREYWIEGQLQDSAIYYHDNGHVHRRGIYRDSNYEGVWKYFYTSGQLEREVTYRDGLPNGKVTIYDEALGYPFMLSDGFYRDGKEDGLWRFYGPGNTLTESGYYEDGEPVGQWYRYDKKTGEKREWKKFKTPASGERKNRARPRH